MVTTATPAPEAPAPDSSNSFSRIFGVLFSPKATFASIAARPTWILPVIIAVVLGLCFTTAIGKRVGWRSVIEKQIASSAAAQKQMDQLPADQREQALDTRVKIAPYFGYTLNVIAPFIGVLLFAAVFMGIFNAVLGARIGFKSSLGVMSYAWLPQIVTLLFALVILFIKDPSTVDIQNVVASNPGAVLSDDSPKWLVALLGSLDLFSFWTLITLSFGYSAADPKKISFGKALGTFIVIWLFYVAVKVGIAVAFS